MGRLDAPQFRTRDAKATGLRMSYQDFLERYDDGSHIEWVDGEVIEMPPIGEEHDRLDTFLLRLLGEYLEHHPLGELRHDPFNMKTGADLPGRSPDILFVTRKNLKRLKKTYLNGPADLAVEIISPGTRAIDRGDKYFEYERGGVSEYWLIDPHRTHAEFYQRDRRGRYQLIPPDPKGVYQSRAIKGLWLKVPWLWHPFPTLSAVRREWGLS
jgi:Uma2 family endonuclease